MLVLARKVGQSIMIGGDDIEVVVVSILNGVVRLGIKAPAGVAVDRAEIRERFERGEPRYDGR